MANLSDAFGTIYLTFPKGLTLANRIQFIGKLAEKLQENDFFYIDEHEVAAVTDLDHLQHFDDVAIRFTGTGRYSFSANMNWFDPNYYHHPYADLLLETAENIHGLDGLEIKIEYIDLETMANFIGKGSAIIKLNGKDIILENHFEEEELTLENYLKYEVGSADEYEDLIS